MDGTLLDLHFDNYFWLHHVPLHYARQRQMPLAEAKQELSRRYAQVAGRLQWYCVDHWSRELGLDIVLLKQEVRHLIQVHPFVTEFLQWLGGMGKPRILVTNAHQHSLRLKLEQTRLRGHLDDVVSTHELGLPKEDPAFWPKLRRRIPFVPERTLFVDDSPAMLRSAGIYGITHLLQVLRPDSRQAPNPSDQYPGIRDFPELLPA